MSDHNGMTLAQVQEQFGQLASFKGIFYDWAGFNKWLFIQINHLRGELYDEIMQLVSMLGDYRNFPFFLGVLLAFAVISSLARKIAGRQGNKQYISRWTGVLAVLCIGFVVNTGTVRLAKDFFHYPRPYVALARDKDYQMEPVYLLETRLTPEDEYRSFPSGHAAFATFMAVALWPLLSVDLQWLAFLYVAGVAWSRVSLGAHFPADVLWSFVMSFLLILGVRHLVYKLLRNLFGINC